MYVVKNGREESEPSQTSNHILSSLLKVETILIKVHKNAWKLPETPDEWREKVSPVIMFTTHHQKPVGFFKKPSHFQKAGAGFLAPKIVK
jgi:hypothetical protein